MKNKITTLLTFVVLSFTSTHIKAENYSTGVGIRLGGVTSGITVKHFFGASNALEGIVSFGGHSFMITGLYEKHTAFPKVDGLTWFFGGGAHVGFFQDGYGYRYFYYKHHDNIKIEEIGYYNNSTSFGFDFILGLDYKFKNVPIDLSLDVKPFFDITPGFYGYWEPGFTFRFTL